METEKNDRIIKIADYDKRHGHTPCLYHRCRAIEKQHKKTQSSDRSLAFFVSCCGGNQYIPSIPPPFMGAGGAGGVGMSVTMDSVVSNVEATDAAF